jgi:hypothetical protein
MVKAAAPHEVGEVCAAHPSPVQALDRRTRNLLPVHAADARLKSPGLLRRRTAGELNSTWNCSRANIRQTTPSGTICRSDRSVRRFDDRGQQGCQRRLKTQFGIAGHENRTGNGRKAQNKALQNFAGRVTRGTGRHEQGFSHRTRRGIGVRHQSGPEDHADHPVTSMLKGIERRHGLPLSCGSWPRSPAARQCPDRA